MKINKVVMMISLSFIMSNSITAQDMTARMIMHKAQNVDNGQTLEQDMIMTLINKSKKTRTKKFKVYSKDYGKDTYEIMFFKFPLDVKDTAFLTFDYQNTDKDDEQIVYLPAVKKTKRIPSSDKSSSFMGTDFSYYDMVKHDLEGYDFKILKETKVNGMDAWVIESIPVTKKEIKESGYIKSIEVVRKDNFIIVRSIKFLKNGIEKKFYSIDKMHKESNIWIFDEISMETKVNQKMIHKTIFTLKNILINHPIDNNIFTIRRLENGL